MNTNWKEKIKTATIDIILWWTSHYLFVNKFLYFLFPTHPQIGYKSICVCVCTQFCIIQLILFTICTLFKLHRYHIYHKQMKYVFACEDPLFSSISNSRELFTPPILFLSINHPRHNCHCFFSPQNLSECFWSVWTYHFQLSP